MKFICRYGSVCRYHVSVMFKCACQLKDLAHSVSSYCSWRGTVRCHNRSSPRHAISFQLPQYILQSLKLPVVFSGNVWATSFFYKPQSRHCLWFQHNAPAASLSALRECHFHFRIFTLVFARAIANGESFQSLVRIILSSLFSWPPQGHSTSSKEKRKKTPALVLHIFHHGQSYMWKQALCWMTSVACTSSLAGISDPDALLCCVNADASVAQHKSAGAGGSSWNSCTLSEITAFTMNFGSFPIFPSAVLTCKTTTW